MEEGSEAVWPAGRPAARERLFEQSSLRRAKRMIAYELADITGLIKNWGDGMWWWVGGGGYIDT